MGRQSTIEHRPFNISLIKSFSENMLSKTISVVISIEQSVVLPLTQMLLPMSSMIVSSVLRCFAQLLLGVARLLDTARGDLAASETPTTSHTTKVVEVPEDVQTIYTAAKSSKAVDNHLLVDECKQQQLRARCDSLDGGIGEDLCDSLLQLQTEVDTVDDTGDVDAETGLPMVTLDEVADHCMPGDAWMVVYDRVYDVTDYLMQHPGGEDVMLEYIGHDATNAFRSVGHSRAAFRALNKYCVGILTPSERLNYEPEY